MCTGQNCLVFSSLSSTRCPCNWREEVYWTCNVMICWRCQELIRKTQGSELQSKLSGLSLGKTLDLTVLWLQCYLVSVYVLKIYLLSCWIIILIQWFLNLVSNWTLSWVSGSWILCQTELLIATQAGLTEDSRTNDFEIWSLELILFSIVGSRQLYEYI